MRYWLTSLVVALSVMVVAVASCGGTETVVETVVVERVITQEPEHVVETVEVEKVVEREVVQTVEVECEVAVEVEKQVVQTVKVEKVVEFEKVVKVEVTAAGMEDDAMVMDDEQMPRNRRLDFMNGRVCRCRLHGPRC